MPRDNKHSSDIEPGESVEHQWRGIPVGLLLVSCTGRPIGILCGWLAGLYFDLLEAGFLELLNVLSLKSFPACDVAVRDGPIDEDEVYGITVNDGKQPASESDAGENLQPFTAGLGEPERGAESRAVFCEERVKSVDVTPTEFRAAPDIVRAGSHYQLGGVLFRIGFT